MQIVVLDSHLFPDRETVAQALARLALEHPVQRIDLGDLPDDDALWDAVVEQLLAADLVVTL
jgi:hypothetical protein